MLEQIKSRGKLPIVVGGTGFYLRALLEGLFAGPERSDELRERLRTIEKRKRALAYLHRILTRLDQSGRATNSRQRCAQGDSCHRGLHAGAAADDADCGRKGEIR